MFVDQNTNVLCDRDRVRSIEKGAPKPLERLRARPERRTMKTPPKRVVFSWFRDSGESYWFDDARERAKPRDSSAVLEGFRANAAASG